MPSVRLLLRAIVLATALVAPAVPALAQSAVTASLEPLGGAVVGGTLTVEPPVGGIATLIVEPTGLAPGRRYGAFLHAGSCARPSASGARLMGVLAVGADGRGRLVTAHATGTGVAFELTRALLAAGDHLVVVREEGGAAVACGLIPRAVGAPTQMPGAGTPTQLPRTGTPAPPSALIGAGLLLAGAAVRALRPGRGPRPGRRTLLAVVAALGLAVGPSCAPAAPATPTPPASATSPAPRPATADPATAATAAPPPPATAPTGATSRPAVTPTSATSPPVTAPTSAPPHRPTGDTPAPAPPTVVPRAPVAVAPTPPASAASAPAAAGLKHLWPAHRPAGFAVDAAGSRAEDDSFVLRLAPPGGGQFHATIVGGQAARIGAASPAGRPVSVRGRAGRELNTGAGAAVYWQEDGLPYGVVTGLNLAEALRVADGLEVIGPATWRERLARAR
jgi:hypothetical protein